VQAFGAHDAAAKVSRSFLFVPADSERKLEKAGTCGADALIIDLEDSVAAAARPQARKLAAEFLKKEFDAKIWVRINSLDSADALEDLKAVMPAAPGGIVLPKPRGAGDANQLAKLLDVLEQESDLDPGVTVILPVATERPAALFRMGIATSLATGCRHTNWHDPCVFLQPLPPAYPPLIRFTRITGMRTVWQNLQLRPGATVSKGCWRFTLTR